MLLEELARYAREKYQMDEQHKWGDFPGFSVIAHPRTGKWIALLMRQWDSESGEQLERCDLKCGISALEEFRRPYLTQPIRMRGNKWIDIIFDRRTEEDVVFRLFDKAVAAGTESGYKLVLGMPAQSEMAASDVQQAGVQLQLQFSQNAATDRPVYHETALPDPSRIGRPERDQIPERIREMRHLYQYGRESSEFRAQNFLRQARFMADYEDDVPWIDGFASYFPTYHDLTTRQLRGYFTWRTQVRCGNFQPIATSAAYIYIYELLNGVGADTPEECIQKLQEFERGYLDSGIGEERMRVNLHRWMLEYAVLNNLPAECARQAADPELISQNAALSALLAPDSHSDAEIFSALCRFGGKRTEATPVLAADRARGEHLFAEIWKKASAFSHRGEDLFTLCFGKRRTRQWFPLYNAVVCRPAQQEDRDYILDECCSYQCRNGLWQVKAYEKAYFDRNWISGLVHEADARLRRYLKTGRYLKENPADAWAIPYIDEVIEEERRALIEAARPKITIDLSGLEQIRRDAETTRESLLTEEDREERAEAEIYAAAEAADIAEESHDVAEEWPGAAEAQNSAEAQTAEPEGLDDRQILPGLEAVHVQIMRTLLDGGDPAGLMKAQHIMPSIAADTINEAFYDEIGDTVLLCEDDRLLLVDDYTDDLRELLG